MGHSQRERSHQTALGKFLKCLTERALHLVEDIEANDAQLAYQNDCFVLGAQHHHGLQLLAAVMDRWPSLRRFGSSKLHRNHAHVAVFTLILRKTYMLPQKKGLVPSLVPLLPCWSVVVKTYETGVFTKTEWVNKLVPWLKCGNPVIIFRTVDCPAAAKFVQDSNRRILGLSGLITYQTRHSGVASIGCGFSELCKKCKKRR